MRHFRRVLVDAGDVVARLGEARAEHQSDVPSSDDRDLHSASKTRKRIIAGLVLSTY